ncbi:FAD-dependent oxidoreductase [Patulibacter minatonensis]|uniref:FAD-dependent oxidoreductase n=1 Tax=Patulibacter minatonensis TaxID=298163 RepID=UPI000687F34D|nr:FAD-dependent oxidoreductase [Patulibacter minatonensis]
MSTAEAPDVRGQDPLRSTVGAFSEVAGRLLGPLDRRLGRIPTYRLIIALLSALVGVSLVLSVTDGLRYDVDQLLASLGIAVGVSYVANRAIAPLARVRPHGESAVITGLLLYFLFWPTTEGGDLLVLAAAAVVATAAKYVLAVRGRHVLNPAAAGAVAVGVLELGATPTWWVAGEELRFYVLAAALVLLLRTRRSTLALTFVLVAGAIVVLRLTGDGVATGDAIEQAFTSYPIVFLAAFMLTEPLTLPPRRWQQLGIAVLVGVLFATPSLHVGSVAMTPELALVLGNVVAFAFGQRRGVRLRYLGRQQLGPSSWEYRFAPVRPVSFSAGQYAELVLPHDGADARGTRRVFTIASAPADRETVAFGVRESPEGSSYKRALAALTPGTTLTAATVAGDFLLPRDRSRPVLLVAGGIGVTPFVSQLRDETAAAAAGRAAEGVRDVVLVLGLGPAEGLPYRDDLVAAGVPVVVVSPERPADLPAGWTHVAAGLVTQEVLRGAVPDAASRSALVSGPPAMVDAVRGALRALGVRRVKTDHFAGY